MTARDNGVPIPGHPAVRQDPRGWGFWGCCLVIMLTRCGSQRVIVAVLPPGHPAVRQDPRQPN